MLRRAFRYGQAERMALIARVSQRIAARLDPAELFATTCAELHWRLGYQHVALFVLEAEQPDILIKRATASRWRANPLGHRHPIDRGLLGAAARERATVLANDVASDPRYVPIAGAPEITAELATPIMLGDRLLGVLDVASTRPFLGDDIGALRIIADQLAVAICNAQLYQDAQDALAATRCLYENSRRQQLLNAARERQLAVLNERRRLARELHDSVTQSLFGLNLLAQAVPDLLTLDPAAAAESLATIRELAGCALGEMRALLYELRPGEAPPASPTSDPRRVVAIKETGNE